MLHAQTAHLSRVVFEPKQLHTYIKQWRRQRPSRNSEEQMHPQNFMKQLESCGELRIEHKE
jgi:hypothetical protein